MLNVMENIFLQFCVFSIEWMCGNGSIKAKILNQILDVYE